MFPTSAARRTCRFALVGMAAALLAACSAQDEPAEAEWTQPAWFAQQAREREEIATKTQSCMDAKGWTLTMDEFGGAAEPFTSEEEADRFRDESTQCQVEAGRDMSAPTEDDLRAAYGRDVDTMMCLRHEGYAMADPPSVDTYIESRLADPPPADTWVPYNDPAVQKQLETGELTEEEFVELELTCPQNWS